MKNVLILILAACGAFAPASPAAAAQPAPSPAPASTPATPQASLIDQMLTINGAKRALRLLPMQMARGFMGATLNSGADEREGKDMLKAMEEAFPRDVFVQHVSMALQKNYDEQRYRHFRQLMAAPDAQRMVELEAAQPTPEQVRNFLSETAKHPLPSARIRLIQRIDEASQASALAARVNLASYDAGAIVAAGGCDDSAAKIRKMVAKNRTVIEKQSRSAVQMSLAFTYRDAPDADLEAYAQALEDKDSKWVTGIVHAAIVEQFEASTQQAAQALKKIVQAHKRHKTMFAPKCGQSESPAEEQRLAREGKAKAEPENEAEIPPEPTGEKQARKEPAPNNPAAQLAVPDNAAGAKQPASEKTADKVAALDKPEGPHKPSAPARPSAKVRHLPAHDRDLRRCLDLTTNAEIIACSEK